MFCHFNSSFAIAVVHFEFIRERRHVLKMSDQTGRISVPSLRRLVERLRAIRRVQVL